LETYARSTQSQRSACVIGLLYAQIVYDDCTHVPMLLSAMARLERLVTCQTQLRS